jgi:3-hydroxybutyrate dehydrogenase
VELQGKTALVTGGGHGLGRGIAEALGRAGAAVCIVGRDEEKLARAVQELRAKGLSVHAFRCDVASEASVHAAVDAAGAELGQIDILVNNAGIAHSAPLSRISLEAWNQVFAVNVGGTFLCTRAVVPGMVARKFGRIVNIASIAGTSGGAYLTAYSASKHAVVGFTRSLALELHDKGVVVNALCPAFIDTDITTGAVQRLVQSKGVSEDEALAAVLGSSGQKRLLSVAEVASFVLPLVGPHSHVSTGQLIVLDGGAKSP